MKRRNSILIVVLCTFLFSWVRTEPQTGDIVPSLQHAVQMVDESWSILDNLAEAVWPGWNTYKDVSCFTAIVGKQDLLINPPGNPKQGFKKLPQTVHGKDIYLRSPGKAEKIWGGAYRYTIGKKRIKGAQFHAYSREYSEQVTARAAERYGLEQRGIDYKKIYGSTEFYIAMIIHESFHLFQRKMNVKKIVNATHPSPFFGNEKHDSLLALEGRILAEAFGCTEKEKSAELARLFLAVRQERYTTLTEEDIHWERRNEFMEGMAQYVETAVWLRLSDAGYRSALLENDPDYHHFKSGEAKRALVKLIIEQSSLPVSDENQVLTRCYYHGLTQAFMLDRLCGNQWKEGFFADGVYFDTTLAERCGFIPDDSAELLDIAKGRFR